jgi:hypothetical protein
MGEVPELISWPPTPHMVRAFAAMPPPENRSSAILRMSMSGSTGSFLAMTTRPCHQNSCSRRRATYTTRSPHTCRASGGSMTSHQRRAVTALSRSNEPQLLGRFDTAASQISRSFSGSWMACAGCESAAACCDPNHPSDLRRGHPYGKRAGDHQSGGYRRKPRRRSRGGTLPNSSNHRSASCRSSGMR